MILKQFYLGCLAHASYFIGDEATPSRPLWIPQRDIDQYVAFAAEHGIRPHVVADAFPRRFRRGSSRAARPDRRDDLPGRRGAASTLSPHSRTATRRARPRSLQGAGDAGTHGRIDLDARVRPRRSETAPRAVLTGDTLFIGDVGRPDLRVALGWSATDLGGGSCTSRSERSSAVARREAGLSGTRRRLAVRQVPQQGKRLHHRRAAPVNYALQPMTGQPSSISSPPISRCAGLLHLDAMLNRGASDSQQYDGARAQAAVGR